MPSSLAIPLPCALKHVLYGTMKTADDVGGGDEAKTRPQGWKILLSLNKQSIDASNIFVNCMRDLLGPSCRDRIVNVQSSLVKTHSKEMQSTKTCLETLENSLVYHRNNSDEADTALDALVRSRENIDKVLQQIRESSRR